MHTTQPACKSCEQTQANLLHHPESIDPLDSSKQSTSQRSTKQSRVQPPAALQDRGYNLRFPSCLPPFKFLPPNKSRCQSTASSTEENTSELTSLLSNSYAFL